MTDYKNMTLEEKAAEIERRLRRPSQGTNFEPLAVQPGDDDATRLAKSREANRRLRESTLNSSGAVTHVLDDMPEVNRQANNFIRAAAARRTISASVETYVPPAPTNRYVSHDERNKTAYEAWLKEHNPSEYSRYMKEQAEIEELRRRNR